MFDRRAFGAWPRRAWPFLIAIVVPALAHDVPSERGMTSAVVGSYPLDAAAGQALTAMRNRSATERARLLAVFVAPNGAVLTVPEEAP
jgi:hypothetical protein